MAILFKTNKLLFGKSGYLPAKKDNIDSMIEKAIRDKLFSLLDINRRIYFRHIEYFITYTSCVTSGEKTISSFRVRLKNKVDKKYKEISAKEIEISGISLVEFDDFIKCNGGRLVKNNCELLENL